MKEIKNFLSFLKRLFRKLKKNEEVYASKDLIQKRRDICNNCALQKRNLFIKRCSLCGCVTDEKTKFIFEECPDDPPKW